MTVANRERRANIWSGAIALWLLLIVVGVTVVRLGPGAAASDAPRYIAYFDDSGGVAKNDSVILSGRRVGRIVGTGVVQRDGRTQARIEFEISRGWMRNEGVPFDSIMKVRAGGLVGRPALVIAAGNAEQRLEPGGDWPRTEVPSNPDPMRSLREDIRRFDANVDQFNAVMADKELFDGVRRFAATARTFLEIEGANLIAGFEAGRRALMDMAAAQPGIEGSTAELRANQESVGKGIAGFASIAHDMDNALVRAMAGVQDVRNRLAAARADVGSMVQATDRKAVGGFFSWLRELSSSWAASMDRARLDPSMAGKLPPRRIWRGFFNGGKGVLGLPDRVEGDKKEPPPQRYKPPPREPFNTSLSD